MKTFFQWAEERKYDLSILTDTDQPENTNQKENAVRTGQGPFYPPAYKSGQYPDEWFAPTKSMWAVDALNRDKLPGRKIVKDAGNTNLR